MRRRFAAASAVVLAACLSASCVKEEPPAALDPPPTPVLTAESRWAVVNRPYVRVLEEPAAGSAVSGMLRKGDIVEVVSKVGEEDGRTYWLGIDGPDGGTAGWVPDSSLDVYDSPDRARTASDALRD